MVWAIKLSSQLKTTYAVKRMINTVFVIADGKAGQKAITWVNRSGAERALRRKNVPSYAKHQGLARNATVRDYLYWLGFDNVEIVQVQEGFMIPSEVITSRPFNTVLINVLNKDMENGIRQDGYQCAIALAVQDILVKPDIYLPCVGNNLYIKQHVENLEAETKSSLIRSVTIAEFKLSSDVRNWIYRWDTYKETNTLNFTIQVHQEFMYLFRPESVLLF